MEKEGSTFKVPLTKIVNITPHPNADSLEFAWVYGFQVIVKKDFYKVGDEVIYAPIDSIIPQWLEDVIFGVDAKIKLDRHRIRQIKIRSYPSQGMIINPKDIESKVNPKYLKLEQDLADIIGITKYEPPVREMKECTGQKTPRNKLKENSRFHKYGGCDNIKWYPDVFNDKEVIIQEKLHGSNCRASYQKTEANTLIKKIKKLFRLLPEYEYCYGSNNVQLQERKGAKGYYGEDVYGAVLEKVDAFSKLKPGETIYGELIGEGIQKNYHYGHKDHKHFVLFDVKVTKEDGSQEYLNPEESEAYAKERGFDFVPVLYRGVFNAELAKSLAKGASVYCPEQKVTEGVVIKSRSEYANQSSKKAFKLINEDYLADKNNTDFH